MKKIIVPIDFSENAINALKYAVELANALGAEIHIVHVFHTSTKAGIFIKTQDGLRLDAKQSLKKLALEYQSKISSGEKLMHHLIRNHPAEGIAYLAKKFHADIIVMGTKGASGLKGAIWGSVASKVLAITKTPVLAVPKYYREFKLNHILFTIDNPAFKERKAIEPLLTLKEKYNTKITTFNLVAPIYVEVNEEEKVLKKSDLIQEISDDYYQSFDLDLKQGVIKYTMNNDVDMICMVKKNRGFFIDMMHISSTKKIIFDSPVPLLILQED